MNEIDTDRAARTPSAITLEELRSWMHDGRPLLLAEMLPAGHYQAGHLPGAVHLPLEGLETAAGRLVADADSRIDSRIVVYCASSTCANSDIAARKLADLGFVRVRVFRGGKAAWRDAGLALVPALES